MPIIIPNSLPAYDVLTNENIFIMEDKRASEQDIRPIEIAIVNLMPTKIETETQLLRLVGNTPLQVNLSFIKMKTYESQNTSKSHLDKFYVSFEDIKNKKFDAMIITGAPVEKMDFEEVIYYEELKKIFDFSNLNVTSTLFICWGAQAGLNYFYGIDKLLLDEKLFGVFENERAESFDPLLKGMDDIFQIPMSRHTKLNDSQIDLIEDLIVLAKSDECGYSIIKDKNDKRIFFTGHSEYDRYTLKNEYLRDKERGLDTKPPKNYFKDEKFDEVNVTWTSSANLLYYNWLNYYVYQVTPY